MADKNVSIDQKGCISCGECAEICPDVFCMNDMDVAQVCGAVTDANIEQVREAVEGCPAEVITLD